MPSKIILYRLFLASPSDIVLEHESIRNVVSDWNIQHGKKMNANIEVVSWLTHSYSEFGERPQELINRQVFDASDIIVGIFWTKFGSPTGKEESGTEEELKKGISNSKKVMIYFSEKPISPDKINTEGYKKIQKFKEEFKDKGLYFIYNDEKAFEKLFRSQLALFMNDFHTDVINTDIRFERNDIRFEYYNKKIGEKEERYCTRCRTKRNHTIIKRKHDTFFFTSTYYDINFVCEYCEKEETIISTR